MKSLSMKLTKEVLALLLASSLGLVACSKTVELKGSCGFDPHLEYALVAQ